MRRELSSFLSAAGLALLTLFVFWELQNYGPESTVRRLHSIVNRISTYLPPELPYDPTMLRTNDSLALQGVVTEPINSWSTRRLIDYIVRPAVYADARFSIYRTDYPNPRTAVTAVLYTPPKGGIPLTSIFVVEKPQQSWKIDPTKTVELAPQLEHSGGMF